MDVDQKRKDRMKIYNSARWKSLRIEKLRDNPLCEICEKRGETKAADDVHHIQSFMSTDNPDTRQVLAFDIGNLMSLCDECHQKVHNGGRGIRRW